MDRRTFITATASTGIYSMLPKNFDPWNPKSEDEIRILFQGDSITDAGRNRSLYYANQAGGMGQGYVFLTVAKLLSQHPDATLKCYNRGISGNKVYQLANRWEDDCLQLKPDILSILIGVNDYWHYLNGKYQGTVKTYEEDFDQLLNRTRESLPNVKLIIGEPFGVKGGTAISKSWYPAFNDYRYAAEQVARKHQAAFIRYQDLYDDALKHATAKYWCPDGVHPSMPGSQIMANALGQVINNYLA